MDALAGGLAGQPPAASGDSLPVHAAYTATASSQAPRWHMHQRGSGEPKGPCDVWPATRSVWRHAGPVFHHDVAPPSLLPCSSASTRRVIFGTISYFHHEESPKLEEGHGEAQHGASWPCNHQGPNADSLYPRQVIARLSPYHQSAWLTPHFFATGGIFCDQQVSWQVKQFSASSRHAICLSKWRVPK